jgi:hypothetical protein
LRRREERCGSGLDGCEEVAGVGKLGNLRFIVGSSESIEVGGREMSKRDFVAGTEVGVVNARERGNTVTVNQDIKPRESARTKEIQC